MLEYDLNSVRHSFLDEYDEVNHQGKMKIKFLEALDNTDDYFITSEEDIANLALPSDVCNFFDCSTISIIPKD